MSNVFEALANREHQFDTHLGMPSMSLAHFDRRRTLMETMASGKGWGKQKKEVRRFADGTTRGDRKRIARERANAAVSEERLVQFMHSAARRRFEMREAA